MRFRLDWVTMLILVLNLAFYVCIGIVVSHFIVKYW